MSGLPKGVEAFATVIQGWTDTSVRPVFHHPTERVIWYLTPAMREQCERNHSQTPERLRQRGGLDWIETRWIVLGEGWGGEHPTSEECRRELLESGAVELRT